MKVYNNTGYTQREIAALPVIGKIRNNWRGRDVTLYKDPGGDILCFMIGITFDKTLTVVSLEPIGLNERNAIDYWNNGQKVLVRD